MTEVPARLVVHVIDDDASVRVGFTRLLRSAQMDVRAYASVGRFLEEADMTMPGCILLDLTMPQVDGTKALRLLRQARCALPVIVVSARENPDTQNLARGLGAKLYLRKPVDDQALLDAISWVTSSQQE